MQKLTFKSEKSSEEVVLSFGILKSTSTKSSEEIAAFLMAQANENSEVLDKHFQKYPSDKIAIKTVANVD